MNDSLWQRVDEVLDRHADPFAQPGLARELARDADAARQVRRLLHRLAALREMGAQPAAFQEPAFSTAAKARPTRFLAAAAVLIAVVGALGYLRDRLQSAPAASVVVIDTVSLVIQRESAPLPRVARVVLEPKSVLEWTHEGEAP